VFTTTFGPLLKALLETFNVSPEHAGRIEGRIKNLRREGLLGTLPTSKGGDSLFSPVEIHKLLYALALAQAGLPPRDIIDLIAGDWNTFAEAIRQAMDVAKPSRAGRQAAGDHYMIVLNVNALIPDAQRPDVVFADARQLRQLVRLASPSAVVINWSKILRKFHDAMAKHHDLTEPVEFEPLLLPDRECQPPKRK
jgi:hypothetical protein